MAEKDLKALEAEADKARKALDEATEETRDEAKKVYEKAQKAFDEARVVAATEEEKAKVEVRKAEEDVSEHIHSAFGARENRDLRNLTVEEQHDRRNLK